MASERVTRYAEHSGGARNLGLSVRGVRVLVQCDDPDMQAAADALAEQIAAIGPEDAPARPAPLVAPVPPPSPPPRPARSFVVGQRVRCNVHGAEGECTITEIGTGRNRGRVKISGERAWCPINNFDAIG